MGVGSLFHIAIKTPDLAKSIRFYKGVLDLIEVERPALDFPGAWLAVPGNEGSPLIHLYAGSAAFNQAGDYETGSSVIDHVSIMATGFYEFRERCEKYKLPWRENVLPTAGLWQLFVHDPSGVMLELTFDAIVENTPEPTVLPERQYKPRDVFFNSSVYQ